jgi:hypothetical protein
MGSLAYGGGGVGQGALSGGGNPPGKFKQWLGKAGAGIGNAFLDLFAPFGLGAGLNINYEPGDWSFDAFGKTFGQNNPSYAAGVGGSTWSPDMSFMSPGYDWGAYGPGPQAPQVGSDFAGFDYGDMSNTGTGGWV